MNSPVIKPTIGRRVWFRPSAAFLASNPILTQFNPEQPMDAGIVYVHHDHMVNLIVTDHVGKTLAVPSVALLAGHYVADEDTDVYCCCEWMPYQKSQAAKTEVADKGIVLEPKYRDPTQREQLEYALVSGAAAHLAQVPESATGIANAIKGVLDALHPEPVLFNPHTGMPRDARDVASDPQAVLCVKPGEPLKAAAITLPVVDPGPDSLEREIQAKADATPRWAQGQAPRVTMDMVNAQIVGETYTVLPSGRVTVCELTLANGFTVRGESAVVFIENNVPQIGREIARENAVNQIWPLLGFRLRDELAAD